MHAYSISMFLMINSLSPLHFFSSLGWGPGHGHDLLLFTCGQYVHRPLRLQEDSCRRGSAGFYRTAHYILCRVSCCTFIKTALDLSLYCVSVVLPLHLNHVHKHLSSAVCFYLLDQKVTHLLHITKDFEPISHDLTLFPNPGAGNYLCSNLAENFIFKSCLHYVD